MGEGAHGGKCLGFSARGVYLGISARAAMESSRRLTDRAAMEDVVDCRLTVPFLRQKCHNDRIPCLA